MRRVLTIVAGASAFAVAIGLAAPGFAQVAGHHAKEHSYEVGGGAANSQGPTTTSAGVNASDNQHPRYGNFDGGGSSASTTGGKPGRVAGGGFTGSGGLAGTETAPPSAPNNSSAGSSGWTP
ncbi:MAG TPA: hypothetical protein VJ718_11345 [Candidatus Binataceae bacterium]|nr:hypothetical protein [Candidatus Binataceae bacterium]